MKTADTGKIKLFLCDLDGVLTDGCYSVFSEEGQISKRFHTRDFHGMSLLERSGVTVGVVTSSRSSITEKQFNQALHRPVCLVGVQDKVKEVEERFITTGEFKWIDIAYIGDDVMDIPLLKKVGVAACPCDAEQDVVDVIKMIDDGYVMTRKGGQSCVREFVNMILQFIHYGKEK